ncbi:hypothetical protein [Escherichia coli]|uniref:hypothetical protein n=1 Tax=Escherichia coli TaxID=562 RepID=UPI0015F18C71|nr:hypothetical protein [Escherichia coli]
MQTATASRIARMHRKRWTRRKIWLQKQRKPRGAEDALKAAGDVIDQPKHDDLTAKHDAVVAAKTPAEAAVNNLPEGPEKEALKVVWMRWMVSRYRR